MNATDGLLDEDDLGDVLTELQAGLDPSGSGEVAGARVVARPQQTRPQRSLPAQEPETDECAAGRFDATAEVVVRWPGNRRFPKLFERGPEEKRACCRYGSNSCIRYATFPDVRCSVHTTWLEGTVAERVRADSWDEGSPAHARRDAWLNWRALLTGGSRRSAVAPRVRGRIATGDSLPDIIGDDLT